MPACNPLLSAGLGLKPEHYRPALDARADGLWFEVHPENYMSEGGPRLAWLEAIRRDHPLSFHGVGLSLGGPEPLDEDHLARWKTLVGRFEPALVSEHLAWSVHSGQYFNDLLPVPMTRDALDRFCDHVDRMQEALGRRILVENPSRYLPIPEEIPEPEFLAETARRTGCGLLIDINNIHVSAHNLGFEARDYLAAIPGEAVGEFHLAGHEVDSELGDELLIDTHGAPVAGPVWTLFATAVEAIGPRPTLIERDNRIPAFEELLAERERARSILLPVPEVAHAG
ncbi:MULTISPECIES: DUF692 domain-containing protein [Alphaproteobacteria]|uniref:UPF0276 protein GCM10017621_34430 n=1 Tax=Maricaulis virginensis TaxID=144022 RepID=A0A9W6MPS6_9PROT|nr:DUF692 domain-containing protein [Maricaulis virginensis]GLK53935.1 UPF0276 protein [Maricaulis virginensis]